MGMTQRLPDDRPVIVPMSRYVVGAHGAAMLGDLVAESAPRPPCYSMPSIWNGPFIWHAREAFADYCSRFGL